MRVIRSSLLLFAATSILLAVAACSKNNSETPAATQSSQAQSTQPTEAKPPRNPLKNAYFGDLHLHTSYSMDAFAFGTRTTPEDSFKYAMGETVEYMGKPQKRIAPLDFLAVTDHAEYLGVVRETINPNGPFAKSEWYTR
jgi:ABC-type Fe3+-hydroxamate transport system substrate-binding protein